VLPPIWRQIVPSWIEEGICSKPLPAIKKQNQRIISPTPSCITPIRMVRRRKERAVSDGCPRQRAQVIRPACSVTHSRQKKLPHCAQRATASRLAWLKQRWTFRLLMELMVVQLGRLPVDCHSWKAARYAAYCLVEPQPGVAVP